MAAWIHSSVSSFLSSTVRLKLSPVVPFTDDKEMLAHTEPIFSSERASFTGFYTSVLHSRFLSLFPLPPHAVLCPDYFSAQKKKESGSETMVPLVSCPDYFSAQKKKKKKEFGSETMAPLVSCPDDFTGDGEGLGMRLLRKSIL